MQLSGLHHVTFIGGAARRTIAFYAGVLGLRLVKLTINYDDPAVYHLYFGDGLGRPGTLLTAFAWPRADVGRQGNGQFNSVALRIPEGALADWIGRLIAAGVAYSGPTRRFGLQTLSLRDPDGLTLDLVATPGAPAPATWAGAPLPPETAISGLHSVTLWAHEAAPTARFLTETLGMTPAGEAADHVQRFAAGESFVELRDAHGFWPGAISRGAVHHAAFRVPDAAAQLAWRERLLAAGLEPTPVRERGYFQAVYVPEPGGALFELATDQPGFTIDEPAEQLGTALQLPPWLEARRAEIVAALGDL
jgi:glyoxalase family protein